MPRAGLLRVLLTGLGLAQLIGLAQVRRSNLALHADLDRLAAAGYLIVPHGDVFAQLTGWLPAWCGGLFFTLTVGALMTLLGLWAAWTWQTDMARSRGWLAALAAVQVALVAGVNLVGFDLWACAYTGLVPPAVFAATLRWLSAGARRRSWTWHVVPVLVLAAAWGSQMNEAFFVDFRDRVLLENPAGRRVNGFYYRYTLYAAEAFKSLDQKQLKTARLDDLPAPVTARRLSEALESRGYLPVIGRAPVDLTVAVADGQVRLGRGARIVLTAPVTAFLNDPGGYLKRFAQRCDRHPGLRQLCLAGVVAGFPLIVYLLIWAVVNGPATMWIGGRAAGLAATVAAFGIGLGLWLPLVLQPRIVATLDQVPAVLRSSDWRLRVAALRALHDAGGKARAVPLPETLPDSPRTAERYWLAQVLRWRRDARSLAWLKRLAADSHPNVVCSAVGALGRRGQAATIPFVQRILTSSDHWYIQWYAYRALRDLGWHQPRHP